MICQVLKNLFEYEIIQVAAAPKSLAIIAIAIARAIAARRSIARYATKIVWEEAEESVKDLVLTLTSSPPSGSDCFFNEARKSCKNKKSEKESSKVVRIFVGL